MATRAEIIAKVKARYDAADEIAGVLGPELSDAIDDYIESLRPALGDLVDDPEIRAELRTEIARSAFEEVVSAAEHLDRLQEVANAGTEGTDVLAYVYLGPDDNLDRAFCDVLVGTWLTREEIDRLNNQQQPDSFVTRGGYNCRHGWYALYDPEELKEFPHGKVDAANAAAVGSR